MDCRWIDVVDGPGIGAEPLDILDRLEDDRELAHGAEDAAGSDSVARAHADAVLLGEDAVDAAIADCILGKAEHHKVCAGQHVLPIAGRLQLQRHIVVGDDLLGQRRHGVESFGIGIDQGQRALVEDGRMDHLPDCLPPEKEAACTDDHDLRVLYVVVHEMPRFDELIRDDCRGRPCACPAGNPSRAGRRKACPYPLLDSRVRGNSIRRGLVARPPSAQPGPTTHPRSRSCVRR